MRCIFNMLLFAFILLFAVSSYAYETVSPYPGEGPVQIAERLGISPEKFIKLNLQLGNFKYPKRVSLIYTWQKFAIPDQNLKIAKKTTTEQSISEYVLFAKAPIVTQTQNVPKYIENGSFNENKIVFLAIGLVILVLIIATPKKNAKEKGIPEFDYGVTEFEEICLKALLLEGDKGKHVEVWNYLRDPSELFFVGRCKATGNLTVIHGSSEYQSAHRGTRGLIDIGRFISVVYGQVGIRNIRFDIPEAYADKYDSIIGERKIFLDFHNSRGSPFL